MQAALALDNKVSNAFNSLYMLPGLRYRRLNVLKAESLIWLFIYSEQ